MQNFKSVRFKMAAESENEVVKFFVDEDDFDDLAS